MNEFKYELGAQIVFSRYLGRIPPGTRGEIASRVSGSVYAYSIRIPGRPTLVQCMEADIILEKDYVPEQRKQCSICEKWSGARSFSIQFDRCSSCLEDMETEDMEEWIRADYENRCTL